jgi:Ca2+-binding RTX toxin-like protein
VDTLADLAAGADRIALDDDVFTAFDAAAAPLLAAAQFHSAPGATAAHDADDRIVYDPSSGALYYDADGAGGAASIRIATLGASVHPAVSAAEFVIVD